MPAEARPLNRPDAASALIGSIYDCALDPSHWDATLVGIQEIMRCENAWLAVIDRVNGSGALIRKTSRIDPYWLERLPLHAAEISSWERLPVVRDLPLDEPQVLSRHLPPEMRQQSRMLKEWAEPQGIVDTMAMVLMNSPTRQAQLGLSRHKDFGLITEREVTLARLLAPHIRRAVTIGDLIDLKTVESESAKQTLDALCIGVVMTDAGGTILHANSAAEAMMRAGGPIQGNGGTLRANRTSATEELHTAIALADREEASLGKARFALRLTDTGEPPVLAHVLSLKHGGARSRLQPKATAVIFVGGGVGGANGAEAMSVAFALTRMETRVLAGLLTGQTLHQTAEELGIARTTARSHLHNLFVKIGVTRQSDLVRVAMQIAAIVR
ncbi:MAG: helix-turn-helix transcriptional regulator [Bradyrhizobium sp.]|uniref:helix-turn-helix transcriptional regulator n=1 Tax=Bradyrhizobium sp. TaxID=376 RepID=UPI00239B258A|nr:helix-turn-helix transcriptional regulator [Bradyrhizobium sp.]MDE2602673.1 helix-turn-helix transcriptional regulator [Bradyrhizobium sp.]